MSDDTKQDGARDAEQARDHEERQRRQNAKRRRARLKWLWLLPLIAIAGFFIWRSQQPATVEVVRPQMRMVVQSLTASGSVEGAREVQLSADVTGVLVEMLRREGEWVQAGDAVARISADLESAELRQAEAAVATARASLSEAVADARTLAPGLREAEAEVAGAVEQAEERLAAAEARLEEMVKGGREEEIREAQAALNQARARLDQAQVEVERARSLAVADATAQAAVEQAEAAARNAAARVKEARSRLAQAERDEVRARRLLDEGVLPLADYEATRTEAETAADIVQQAKAGLEQAQVEVDNQRTLLAVTREQELDRALAERVSAREQLRQAEARLEIVANPARGEQIEAQEAEVRAARSAVVQAREAGPARVESIRLTPTDERVRVAERRLEEAIASRNAVLVRLERTTVKARFTGIITEVMREPGDVVTPGQPIAMVSEMDWPEVRVEIDERNIAEVKEGLEAYLTADAYPEITVKAVVDRISPRAITERGIIDVIMRLEERPEWLRPGMTADANIVVAPEQELAVVPTRAVVREAGETFVLLVEDGEVRRESVETGVNGLRGTVIRSHLPEEALVVIDPAAVQIGQRVNPVEISPALDGETDV